MDKEFESMPELCSGDESTNDSSDRITWISCSSNNDINHNSPRLNEQMKHKPHVASNTQMNHNNYLNRRLIAETSNNNICKYMIIDGMQVYSGSTPKRNSSRNNNNNNNNQQLQK